MYANKKLFLATLQYQVYVLADDGNKVEEFTRDITEIERPTVEAEEVQSNVLKWEQTLASTTRTKMTETSRF